MRKILMFLVLSLFFVSIAEAGSYFRVGPSLSYNQSHDISLFGNDLGVDADNPGFGFAGALGYKPHARNESGFFGEIESGYSESDGSFTYIGERSEGQEINVETTMDFVHVFFNVGYEHALSYAVIDGKPAKISVYAGAGPVFSEIHADIETPRGGEIQLDNIEGDTTLGWQAGADLWVPVLSDLEIGIGAKYIDRGLHRTIPGVKYENNSIDGTVQARFWF